MTEQEQVQPAYVIGTVERDTGIGRDTLRIWERRYGFPTPVRNDKGERVYDTDQIRRLQLIRRLLDQGYRPGKVVPLDEATLTGLAHSLADASTAPDALDAASSDLLRLAIAGDQDGLDAALERILVRDGLRGFVLETLVPLISAVGELWAGGQLQIFEEHLLSRHLMRFLDVASSRLGRPSGAPRVLLATLPGERHVLGLSMVEALLWHGGTATLNLGADIPMDQIASAVQRSRVAAVALSFSACYPRGPIRAQLEELSERLPQDVEVWIGGSGVRRLSRLPETVVRKSLDSL